MTTHTAGPWKHWWHVFNASAPKRSNSENNVDWNQLVTAILASGSAKRGYAICGLPDWSDDELEALWTESGGIHASLDRDAIRRFINITWLMHGTPWPIAIVDDVVLPTISETRDLMTFVVVDHIHRPTIDARHETEDFDDALVAFPARFIAYAQRSAARAPMAAALNGVVRNGDVLRAAAFRDPEARRWAWSGGLGGSDDAESEVAWELANYVTAWLARRARPDAPIATEPPAAESLATAVRDAILAEMTSRGQHPTVAMELVAEQAAERVRSLTTAAA